MSSAHDQDDDHRGSPVAGCLIIGVMMLPLYVLSAGPAHWLIREGYLPGPTGIIYAPLFPFMYIEPISDLFQWYLKFFE